MDDTNNSNGPGATSSSATGSYHNYVVTAQKPTKVTHTAVGNFLSPTENNLLVGRVTYIEVYSITKEGLVATLELPIYGRMVIMKLFRLPGDNTDSLLVMTEKHKLFVIRWNAEKKSSENLATAGDVMDSMGTRRDKIIGIVDPNAKCFALQQFEHLLKIIPTNFAAASFNVRLYESDIKDIIFLHGNNKPTIAILFNANNNAAANIAPANNTNDANNNNNNTNNNANGNNGGNRNLFLKLYEISMNDEDISLYKKWQPTGIDPSAHKLISIPDPIGGIIVIAINSVMYLSENGPCVNQPMESRIIKSIGKIDAAGTRFLLGDHKGNLILLVLSLSNNGKYVSKLQLQTLGETSITSCISYLDNGYVFVGSDHGDSQLIKLQPKPNPKNGSHINIRKNYNHLGPITDFCIVKGSGYLRQGQGQVVTCSGIGKDGSLRIIRNGIGITEQASADLPGIKAMFSLKRHIGDEYHSFIMQSFMAETRTLELLGEYDMAPTSFQSLDESKATLHAANVVGDQIVQITEEGLRLFDCTSMSGNANPAWKPPAGTQVSSGTGTNSQILIATTGGNLFHINIDETNKGSVTQTSHVKFENEISCLDCSTLVLGSEDEDSIMILPEEKARIAVIGLWADVGKSPVVKIISLPSLETLHTVNLGGETMARSVLLATLEGSNYLLVGLGDGYLLTYAVNLQNALELESTGNNLTEERKIKLRNSIVGEGRKLNVGTQPANLSTFRSRGSTHVFAACDRPTVVYSASGVNKLLLSNVNLQGVTRVCSFHTEFFPDCLAIALENTFQLGAVDEIQKLHINKVPLGDQPRRIAHMETARAFAVLTEKAGIDENGEDELKYHIRLIHDSTYDNLANYPLEKCEVASAITTCHFKTSENNGNGNTAGGIDEKTEYLVVGTTIEVPDEEDPKAGRILVFVVNDNRLVLVAEQHVAGATYCLCPFDGKIIAGVNALVIVYSLIEEPNVAMNHGGMNHGNVGNTNMKMNNCSLRLHKEDLHHGQIVAYRIETKGNYILVGDIMRSLTLLTWKPQNAEHKLEEVAKDYDPAWTLDVEMLDEDVYVMADHKKNLYTFRRNSYANTEAERTRLERIGMFHIGAMVNRVQQGSLVMHVPESERCAVTKTLIFGTADGMIGVIATLRADTYRFFHELQNAIVETVRGIGGLKHTEWREILVENPTRSNPSKNYIDGDIIERLSDLGADDIKAVADKMKVGTEELLQRVEEMQRLHGAG